MKTSIEKGLSIKIEGELGKFQTLPITSLIKIAESLQKLVQTIAKLEIKTEGGIDLENFNVELSGFEKGSAIPVFMLTPRIKYTTGDDLDKQRSFVDSRLDSLLAIANVGDYSKLKNQYPEPYKRNQIVEDFYSFTSCFGNSPTSFGNMQKGSKFKSFYKLNKFKEPIKKALISTIKETKKEETISNAVGNIKIVRKEGGKIEKRITNFIEDSHAELSYSTDTIVFKESIYELNSILRSKILQEDEYFIIENELLDISGSGKNKDEAEVNFAEEFDFIYKRYNQLPEQKLSERLKRIKTILNSIIKKVSK